MTKMNVQLEVEKATYEVGEAIGKTVKDIVAVLKKGNGSILTSTAIISALIADLAPVISDFSALPVEAKESLPDFLASWMASGLDLWKGLKS